MPREVREHKTFYDGLNREGRVEALCEMLTAEALDQRTNHHSIEYSDVQALFEQFYGKATSHDYAYTLMRAASEHRGFTYDDSTRPTQLQITVTEVADRYLEAAEEYATVDSELVDALTTSIDRLVTEDIDFELTATQAVDVDVTSYTAAAGPPQQAFADDDDWLRVIGRFCL